MNIIESIKERIKIAKFQASHREQLGIMEFQFREELNGRLIRGYLDGRIDLNKYQEIMPLISNRIDLRKIARAFARNR